MAKIVENVVMEVLKKVRDPELGSSVVDAGLVSYVSIDEGKQEIEVFWVPTVPFCPMVLAISAAMLYALRKNLNLGGWRVRVLVDESVVTADYWNNQLRDEETMNKIVAKLEETGQIKYFISQ